MKKTNIVLIGMPSSGKTSVGKYISEKLGYDFCDTDGLYLDSYGVSPRETVISDGRECFLEKQNKLLQTINVANCVISTGGACIYNEEGMNHLKTIATVVFLKVPYEVIEKRVSSSRPLTGDGKQSLHDLFMERLMYYKKYSDIDINCENYGVEHIGNDVLEQIGGSI